MADRGMRYKLFGNKRFKKLMQEDGTIWDTVLTGLAEMIGTAILVFLGCMGCIGGFSFIPSHLQLTLSFGLTVMVVIQCFGHISHAHVNPAMTVGAVVVGKKSLQAGLVYLLAQTIGAVLGYGLLKAMTPHDLLHNGNPNATDTFCVTDLHDKVSAVQGLFAEGLATGILTFFACSIWDSRNAKNTDSVALKFGFAVAVLANTIGPYTGCSMNPVRSFGPAIWNNQWNHHWIYWFGPLGGALLASLLYRAIFSPKKISEEEAGAEMVALNGVETEKLEVIS
ncbi:aquaporin AQPAe.a isoform X4 [Cephus cinctus]|uniref:Aquaporin AQPAe.a isoform X4 n=1 Tax=Cephus cinctus TaxID=211228 RepID=A0AAJ7C258_CEPCN|nr:aquaporin AQPAe.a isoform X4 [Cephus cinctus]